MKTVCLSRDNIAPLVKTAYPEDALSFGGDEIVDCWVNSPWGWPLMNTPLTVDEYNATDWADVTKPDVPEHIMFNGVTKEFKANFWLVGDFGDMLFVNTRMRGEMGPSA